MTESLPSHDKLKTDEGLLQMQEQERWFAEMQSPGEDAVEVAEVTTKDLGYCMISVPTAAAV